MDCANYFPLLGYTKYGNSRKQRKIISRFSRCALRPALGTFLRDMGGKIAGIPQCRTLGTTLLLVNEFDAQSLLHGLVSLSAVIQIYAIHEANGCKNLKIHLRLALKMKIYHDANN